MPRTNRMTLRELKTIVDSVAQDEDLLEMFVYPGKVDRTGVAIIGPTKIGEYGRTSEFCGYCAYFTLPWTHP